MSNLKALGLELEYDGDDSLFSPMNAIVIAEGMDNEGKIRHEVIGTPGLTNVQAAGFVHYATEWVNLNLMNDMIQSMYADDSEEE